MEVKGDIGLSLATAATPSFFSCRMLTWDSWPLGVSREAPSQSNVPASQRGVLDHLCRICLEAVTSVLPASAPGSPPNDITDVVRNHVLPRELSVGRRRVRGRNVSAIQSD